MNIRAKATFRAGSFSAFEAKLVPRLVAAVDEGTAAVLESSQEKVPVDTGELKSTGRAETEWKGSKVIGTVTYGEGLPDDRATYVEFGTGRRGAGSPGAGPYTYNLEWPGMVAQPYIRPALDDSRDRVKRAFADQGFKV